MCDTILVRFEQGAVAWSLPDGSDEQLVRVAEGLVAKIHDVFLDGECPHRIKTGGKLGSAKCILCGATMLRDGDGVYYAYVERQDA